MASYEVEIWTAARACGRARALFRGQFLDFSIFLLIQGDAAFPRGHAANTQGEGLFALFSCPVLRLWVTHCVRLKRSRNCSQPVLDDSPFFSDSWSNSAQLEIPYVCPNGLVRVLSPPPFLTPKEVRPAFLSLSLHKSL